MDVRDSVALVLGGYGLVGSAVCREILARNPRRLVVHSLRPGEAERAVAELADEAGGAEIVAASGDLFGVDDATDPAALLSATLDELDPETFGRFRLTRLLREHRPRIVVDCVNTATAIAYRDVYSAARRVSRDLDEGALSDDGARTLLEALYVPRLVRHLQVIYRGMVEVGTRVYVKVGTSGTGGMGLNIPYTHSEERPSRVLLSKSAVAGAHSALLFLMARTPGAPITKEVKPAAAIAWKEIAHGPIVRRGETLRRVRARPRPLGEAFSTVDAEAAEVLDAPLEATYIDTGENGLFSIEEFAALTTATQMEFVTPEEIAQTVLFEIEGGNTGHDIVNALDNAILGPSYRAGLMRHWALERMNELQREHGTASVAFEMLGPPRVTKLLFEAHLLGLAFETMDAVRTATPEEVAARLDRLVRHRPDVASDVAAVGIPVLLASGELIRGPTVIVPANAEDVTVTPERLETWARDGWVDLRLENAVRWVERFRRIHEEVERIPAGETSSRHLRNRRFWDEGSRIQSGKVVGWILSVEERGARLKD